MMYSSRVEERLVFIRMPTITPVLHVHEIDKPFLKMEEEIFLLKHCWFINQVIHSSFLL